jgi:predicted dehydrogenase
MEDSTMAGPAATRREFIGRAGAAAASLSAAVHARAQGANDRIRLALLGAGGRGTHHMRTATANPDVDLVAVCDASDNTAKHVAGLAGGRADTTQDFRRVLDRKDVDAVVIATPDHWHCPMAILAFEAGKDAYVEKPLGHNIAEGRAAVNAAARHKRVAQFGTQQLSGEHYAAARELVRSGALGRVTRVRVWNVWNEVPDGMGRSPDGPPPDGLDFDLWLGPAPKRPYNREFVYGRGSGHTFFWDVSGGYMLAWAVHHIDTVHWILGRTAPRSAFSTGGKFLLTDIRDTPDTQDALLDYGDFYLQASIVHTSARGIEASNYGIAFYGSNGTLRLLREGYEVYPEGDRMPASRSRGSLQDEPHMRNFLDCVKSRNETVAPLAWGHQSTNPLHLANISYKVGRSVRWDAEKELIAGDTEANRHLSRTYRAPWGRVVERYLAEAHKPYYRETADGG